MRARIGVLAATAVLAAAAVVVTGGDEKAPAAAPAPAMLDQGGVVRELTGTTVEAMLARRSRAIATKDRAAFLASVDEADPAFRAAQARWFDNLSAVPFEHWEYRLNTAADPGPSAAPGSDLAAAEPQSRSWVVEVTYAIADYDPAPQRRREVLTFVSRRGAWVVSARADAPGQRGAGRDLWEIDAVNVARTARALVLGLPERTELMRYAEQVEAAIPKVEAVWGTDWPRRVLVLVTRTENEMAQLLGGRPEQYRQLAAVARGEVGGAPGSEPAERIVLNPRAYGELTDVGREVIMAHEIAHVAMGEFTQAWTPTWLAEGFADYVGYRTSGLPRRVVAQELVADLQRGFRPRGLPGDDAFSASNPALAQAYELAWLAFLLIVEDYGGREALVRFVRAAGDIDVGPGAVDAAFTYALGVSREQFLRDWRAYVPAALR
ncbi:MAG: hypothetical protein ACT4P1_14255 [Sporichthyaceae bacterium]